MDDRAAEIEAVMDAVGFENAAVFGLSEGGPPPSSSAAERPERTRALILYGTLAFGGSLGWEDLERDPAEVRALTSTLEITKTVTVTAPPPPSVPKTTMETDGTYRVGTDIVPGTYSSAGTLALREQPIAIGRGDILVSCTVLSSLNETHIIDSNIGAGPQVVMIQPSDRAFLTHSCQPWQKAD